MLEGLASLGKNFAKEFVESGQDLFVMVADVEGKQVTVTAKFTPAREGMGGVSREEVFKRVFPSLPEILQKH